MVQPQSLQGLQDQNVVLPEASALPPTLDDRFRGMCLDDGYRDDTSTSSFEQYPVDVECNAQNDDMGVTQVEQAVTPNDGVPPWFLPAMNQALTPMWGELTRVMNHDRGGFFFDIVPFLDGSDPTNTPHGLPPLLSHSSIDALDDQQLVSYLNGYGVSPPQTVSEDPRVTTFQRQLALRNVVSIFSR